MLLQTNYLITAVLDMDFGELGFVVNGQYLGPAFSGLRGKKLYLTVSAVWGQCSVTMKYIWGTRNVGRHLDPADFMQSTNSTSRQKFSSGIRNGMDSQMTCSTTNPSGMAPFELLPPEVAEIIIKMAMNDNDLKRCCHSCPRIIEGKHEFLHNVIMKVSKRFQTFGALESLWRGESSSCIAGGTEEIKETMMYLGDGISSLNLHGNGNGNDSSVPCISDNEILGIAERCPNLTHLSICSAKLESMPTQTNIPWTSLRCVRLWNIAIGEKPPFGESSSYIRIENGLYFL